MSPLHHGRDCCSAVSGSFFFFDRTLSRWIDIATRQHVAPTPRDRAFTLITWYIPQEMQDDSIDGVLWQLRHLIAPLEGTNRRTRTVQFNTIPMGPTPSRVRPKHASSEDQRSRLSFRAEPERSRDTQVPTHSTDRASHIDKTSCTYVAGHPCVIFLQGLTPRMLQRLTEAVWVREQFLLTPGPQAQRAGGWPDGALRGNVTLVSRALAVPERPYVLTFLRGENAQAHSVFVVVRLLGSRRGTVYDVLLCNTRLERKSRNTLLQQAHCLTPHLIDAAMVLGGSLGDAQLSQLHEHRPQNFGANTEDRLFSSKTLIDNVSDCVPLLAPPLPSGLRVLVSAPLA